jgi:hypothetical protein
MARFILDVMLNEGQERSSDIVKILEVIERDQLLSNTVTSIRLIDETNDNQFYSHDSFKNDKGEEVVYSPMMNVISEKQIAEDKLILSTY